MSESLFGEVVYAYTRAQALADGVLVDLTPLASRMGFRYPVACTSGVLAVVAAGLESHEVAPRLHDMLLVFRAAAKATLGDRCEFQYAGERLWSLCGPGDSADPVITIMLEGED